MNAVHAAVIRHLRSAMAERPGKLARDFREMSDEMVMKLMFSNVRGRGAAAKGLRLTSHGLDIMGENFKYVEIKFREERKHPVGDLLYLEREARLPYFCSAEKIVLFETTLGVKLRFYDGDIGRLRQDEGA
jgi:hypothetical protein